MFALLEETKLPRVREEDRDPDVTDDQIPGPHKEFARLIRRLTSGLSTRGIANKTGVNFSTIATMLQGGRANQESLIKFGRAYRTNPNVLLRLTRQDEIPEFDVVDWTRQAVSDPDIVTIAPGRPVRVIRREGEGDYRDVVLTQSAVDMILTQDTVNTSRN